MSGDLILAPRSLFSKSVLDDTLYKVAKWFARLMQVASARESIRLLVHVIVAAVARCCFTNNRTLLLCAVLVSMI